MISPYKILMYKGKSNFSWIIKPLMDSKYSHCAITLPNNHVFETDILYSASIRNLKYKTDDYDLFEYNGLTEKQIEKINEYIYASIGKKYSMWENFRFILYKWFGIESKDDSDRTNCIESIIEAFKNAEICITNKLYPKFEDIVSNPNIIQTK